jgi:hypothetical protein
LSAFFRGQEALSSSSYLLVQGFEKFMEIGLREWLIVIGIIVIAGILFDGWRRMRGGKGKLKFKLDHSCSARRGCWTASASRA